MSVSEDEDDFLSADEDVDEERNSVADNRKQPEQQPQPRSEKQPTITTGAAFELGNVRPIDQGPFEKQRPDARVGPQPSFEIRREKQEQQSANTTKISAVSGITTPKSASDSSESEDSAKVGGTPDEEDPDEEAFSERIRERNLKIARKFSAELAKNIKASAPIPVNGSAPIGFKISNIEYPNISDTDAKEGTPPAPPPTPALSSSFSNADDVIAAAAAAASATTVGVSSGTSGLSTTGASQYGWRVPNKSRPKQPPQAPQQSPPEDKSAQARQALDRLSENLSFASSDSKNLFERVAEDLRKVSIKSDQPASGQESFASFNPANIPLISDLGSTLGGWNWNSASKLLASASQVTQQIGSVLDSVVNPAQQAPGDQTEQKTTTQSIKQAQPESS